ncbi:hypothetical protein M404DRAFT_998475 [Pisolithus tinctorius Marx 270]|uniref:Uncharacterized protein n=1 Tax=Pisolithus tinctorius Marx 270 TaxID=870435 RepID=A0A0C3KBM1_PISTI|nr:hypothetical protein M404DRAFT_998475 [Pisolithus tinctorius Marx 270]
MSETRTGCYGSRNKNCKQRDSGPQGSAFHGIADRILNVISHLFVKRLVSSKIKRDGDKEGGRRHDGRVLVNKRPMGAFYLWP